MGRGKNHNKSYISMSEWVNEFGGKKEGEKRSIVKPLPFNCCSLTLQPFEDPMSTEDGNLYDMLNIIPFIKKYGKDPVTGKKVTIKDLFKVHFSKNSDDEYECPITKKVFTEYSKIVCIRTTGNIYSYDAVQKLNIDAKNWTDLLSDTPFTKKDIIVIQDPADFTKKTISNFNFLKEGIDAKSLDEDQEKLGNINIMTETTKRIYDEMREKGIEITKNNVVSPPTPSSNTIIDKELSEEEIKKQKEFQQFKLEKEKKLEHIKKHSSQAPSFTSTGFSASDMRQEHPADEPGKKTKKKGYVTIQTNLGNINLMIHCDLAPKASENFLEHCESGYYQNQIFHRLIRNFMIQGGDPTGTGTGGQSIWKKSFKDEFTPTLKHSERGILSMANSGTNTNGSQFFITFRDCPHLDNKHTVFGKVVGGLEILKTMELVKVDQNDKPLQNIKILFTKVLANPFRTLDEEEFEEKKRLEKKKKDSEKDYRFDDSGERGAWFSNPTPQLPATNKTGVGKYLPSSNTTITGNPLKRPSLDSDSDTISSTTTSTKKTKVTNNGGYGNFSNF
eukprot:gene2901-3612_t